MFLILFLLVILLLFGGGIGYPSGRNVLWIIAAVLLIFWLFGALR